MNQKREVETRTAQLLVCSAFTGAEARKGARRRGSWRRLLSFMLAIEFQPVGALSVVGGFRVTGDSKDVERERRGYTIHW